MRKPEEPVQEIPGQERPWPAGPEAPDADVADQRREVIEESPAEFTPGLPLEADPADVADQQRVVTDLDDEVR